MAELLLPTSDQEGHKVMGVIHGAYGRTRTILDEVNASTSDNQKRWLEYEVSASDECDRSAKVAGWKRSEENAGVGAIEQNPSA